MYNTALEYRLGTLGGCSTGFEYKLGSCEGRHNRIPPGILRKGKGCIEILDMKLGNRVYLICSGEPPDVALVMAQAASFRVLNSAFPRMSMRTGKMLALITAWSNIQGILTYRQIG